MLVKPTYYCVIEVSPDTDTMPRSRGDNQPTSHEDAKDSAVMYNSPIDILSALDPTSMNSIVKLEHEDDDSDPDIQLNEDITESADYQLYTVEQQDANDKEIKTEPEQPYHGAWETDGAEMHDYNNMTNIASNASTTIKVEYEEDANNEQSDQQMTIKTDPDLLVVKNEMYADHEIKHEHGMVIGPTQLLKSITGSIHQDGSSTLSEPDIYKNTNKSNKLKVHSQSKKNKSNHERKVHSQSKKNKSNHERKVHSQSKPSEFPCNFCNRTFRSEEDYTKHKIIHAGLKIQYAETHVCEVCTNSFASLQSLSNHMGLHDDEKRFPCTKCDKKFYRNRDLTQHLYVHKTTKPFPCKYCDKRFIVRHRLKRHMQTHLEIKKFQCDICEKTFKRKSDISLHLRTHSGDRPYACTQCDAKFTHSGNLWLHMSKHSNDKPFLCKLCLKTYKSNWNLVRHMRTHDKFTCKVCNQQFKQIRTLKSHNCEPAFTRLNIKP